MLIVFFGELFSPDGLKLINYKVTENRFYDICDEEW